MSRSLPMTKIIKPVLLGCVAIVICAILSSLFNFWFMNSFAGITFDGSNEITASSVLEKLYHEKPLLLFISMVAGTFIQFFFPGIVVGTSSHNLISKASLICFVISISLVLIPALMNSDFLRSVFYTMFTFIGIFLAIIFFFSGVYGGTRYSDTQNDAI